MVRDMDGRVSALHNVSSTSIFGEVIKRIEMEKGINVELSKFLWGGKVLDPGNSSLFGAVY
jgi:hypothetical protein